MYRRHSDRRQTSVDRSSTPNARPTPPPSVDDAEPIKRNTNRKTKPKATPPEKSGPKKLGRPKKLRQKLAEISGEDVIVGGHSTGAHPLAEDGPLQEETTKSANPGGVNTCLQEDLNLDRRKRRKVSIRSRGYSPDDEREPLSPSSSSRGNTDDCAPSWQLQLQAAASAKQELTLKDLTVSHAREMILDKRPATPPTLGAVSPPKVAISDHNPPSSFFVTPSDGTIPDSLSAEEPCQRAAVHARDTSPRKKMLRLNAEGRFSSPVAKVSSKDKDLKLAKAPQKPKTPALKSKKFVVVLRYGQDAQSRAALGARIAQILEGSCKDSTEWQNSANRDHSNIVISEQSESKKRSASVRSTSPPVTPRASKLAVPLKPTHPFFIAKPSQKPDIDSAKVPSPENGNSNPKRDPILSSDLRKPRTPKKLVARPESLSGATGLSHSSRSPPRSRGSNYPGAIEPVWPCKGTVHVRGLDSGSPGDGHSYAGKKFVQNGVRSSGVKKLKETIVQVPTSEDIILRLASELKVGKHHKALKDNESSNSLFALRLPSRSITTGPEIQRLVREQVQARLLARHEIPSVSTKPLDKSTTMAPICHKAHPALSRLHDGIRHTLTPFDKGECESHAWVHKYAPVSTEEILQPGREALVLRDWLRSLMVQAVDTGSCTRDNAKGSEKAAIKPASSQADPTKLKRRKRKRAEELQGFVISSDEEGAEMNELSNPEDNSSISGSSSLTKKTVARSQVSAIPAREHGKLSNAVVISGPHGCGKTAAVYAVAQELGYEVFEINSGSRRSGKDVLDRVGDMTRNHLVQHANVDEGKGITDDLSQVSEALKEDLATGRQGTMMSFFKPESQTKQKAKAKAGTRAQDTHGRNSAAQYQKQQKQSLILLEEVDVLFPEDKQFWSTVLSLVSQSKRPIVMTCNDESLIQMDALSPYAILRFVPPSYDLAVDYLLLLAAKEGHILARDAIIDLYKVMGFDLRASIMELDFWCQIAVGDRRGGLEWIYQRWPPGKDVDEQGEVLRVASKGTYLSGMGWLAHVNGLPGFDTSTEVEEDILLAAWDDWQVEIEDIKLDLWAADLDATIESSRAKRLAMLSSYDTYAEAISAADVYSGMGLRVGSQILLDTTQPQSTGSLLFDFTEGNPLLTADPMIEYSRLGARIELSIRRFSRDFLREQTENLSPNSAAILRPLSERDMTNLIRNRGDSSQAYAPVTRADFSAAFDALAEGPNAPIAQSQGFPASVFDGTFSVVVEDLAPYVRTIVAYDLQLEEERLQLSNLLSQGGRNGKRMRTTRASRSALEGGNRSNTRRERWFPKQLNAALVLETGGKKWPKVGSERGLHAGTDAMELNGSSSSRRSSDTSISIAE